MPASIFSELYLFELLPASLISLSSAALSFAIVMTKGVHGKHTNDHHEGIQKFHTAPTPRIGGLAIVFGLIVALLVSPYALQTEFAILLVAGAPAFLAGFLEDITRRVGVGQRLLATMLSGLLAWGFTGYRLDHIGVPGVDVLLAYPFVSIAFTAFAVGGVANAINIIDGFNGLAGGTAALCFAALGFIALQAGDLLLVGISFSMVLILLGFLLVNFPFGKIFMGDGGAYLVGFLLAWTSVMLPARNPEVSVWAPVLVAAYPIIETLFSMARRKLNRAHPGQPDCEHLHSLIKIKVVRPGFPSLSPSLRNGLVSPFCWSFAALPIIASLFLYQHTLALQVFFLGTVLLYALLYYFLHRMPSAGLDCSR